LSVTGAVVARRTGDEHIDRKLRSITAGCFDEDSQARVQ
jgi:hypothetical protein